MDYKFYQNILNIKNINFTYDVLINFFNSLGLYNDYVFKNIEKCSRKFDIENYLYNPPIGCYYDITDGKITSYKLSLPNIEDLLTILINIHELVHALILDSRLNEPFTNICTNEILPMFYEFVFVEKMNNKELSEKYSVYLNTLSNQYDKIHQQASKKLNTLIKYYDTNSIKTLKKCKKIVLNVK